MAFTIFIVSVLKYKNTKKTAIFSRNKKQELTTAIIRVGLKNVAHKREFDNFQLHTDLQTQSLRVLKPEKTKGKLLPKT
ncbi:hypothetical protein SCB49_02859 [unidentified eubacterium SCB49]|nr:hypothetical protein SCB49_02859 [unidentified eubacterium SCB49]